MYFVCSNNQGHSSKIVKCSVVFNCSIERVWTLGVPSVFGDACREFGLVKSSISSVGSATQLFFKVLRVHEFISPPWNYKCMVPSKGGHQDNCEFRLALFKVSFNK